MCRPKLNFTTAVIVSTDILILVISVGQYRVAIFVTILEGSDLVASSPLHAWVYTEDAGDEEGIFMRLRGLSRCL